MMKPDIPQNCILTWDAATNKEFEAKQVTNDVLVMFSNGVRKRAEAKTLKEKSDALIEEANEELQTAFIITELEKVKSNYGSVTPSSGKKETIQEKPLRELLADQGMEAETIDSILETATKVSPWESVVYRKPSKVPN